MKLTNIFIAMVVAQILAVIVLVFSVAQFLRGVSESGGVKAIAEQIWFGEK